MVLALRARARARMPYQARKTVPVAVSSRVRRGACTEHGGDAGDASADQKEIGESAEGDDEEYVFAPQTLAQHEGILSADGDDQRRADGKSGGEG